MCVCVRERERERESFEIVYSGRKFVNTMKDYMVRLYFHLGIVLYD